RRPDTLELRLGGREPGRAKRGRVERGGRQATEIPHATAQDAPRQRPPRFPGLGGERPSEADSRRNVQLSGNAVGADAEPGIEGAVVGWGAAELRRLEAGAVGELQPGARAPCVAQVQRLVPRRPCLCEGREGSAERRRPSRLERLERVKHEGAKRSEEHTSELQSPDHLVCPLLLEKKK